MRIDLHQKDPTQRDGENPCVNWAIFLSFWFSSHKQGHGDGKVFCISTPVSPLQGSGYKEAVTMFQNTGPRFVCIPFMVTIHSWYLEYDLHLYSVGGGFSGGSSLGRQVLRVWESFLKSQTALHSSNPSKNIVGTCFPLGNSSMKF